MSDVNTVELAHELELQKNWYRCQELGSHGYSCQPLVPTTKSNHSAGCACGSHGPMPTVRHITFKANTPGDDATAWDSTISRQEHVEGALSSNGGVMRRKRWPAVTSELAAPLT